jgi:predicted lysophospholipase L1 biosynthesis ABC-type transport system permease subunit
MSTEPLVAVVNEEFVRRYLDDRPAVGARFGWGNDAEETPVEVVGVVADVAYQNLSDERMPAVHIPYPQGNTREMTLAVRTFGDPLDLAPQMRAIVSNLDRDLPLYEVRTQRQQQDVTLATQRQFVRLSSLLGALALLLASIGLYGVLSYSVARRTREIGLRKALGASRGDLVRLVYGELRPVLLGIALGLAGAVAFGNLLESQLYGISGPDPVSLLGATAILVVVAAGAAWLPARRAAGLDPVEALRE